MSAITSVSCDGCGRDITSTGNSCDYRIVLSSQSKPHWAALEGHSSYAVTDMFIADPMPVPKHFCFMSCLVKWLTEEGHIK